jgi:hypothetical protein
LPLLFSFALQYATKKIQENREGLDLNGTHQDLLRSDDVNLMSESMNTVETEELFWILVRRLV